MPVPILGLALGIGGAIGKMFGRGKANRQMKKLLVNDPQYKENPLAQERLGLAKTLLNARAPGAMAAERNIYSSGANAFANAGAASTDASQLLATAGDIQANTNQAFNDLGQQETADYQRRYGNVVGAQEGVINEQDKVFQDRVRRFQNEAQIKGAINENRQSGWGDISNLGFGLLNFGMSGGYKGMFGGGNGGQTQGGQVPTWNNGPTSWQQLQGNIGINPNDINATNRNRWP